MLLAKTISGLFAIVLTGCLSASRHEASESTRVSNYDLKHPVRIKLPLELDEISGLVFYNKDTSLLAIQDENGMLYKIPLSHPNHIQKWKFAASDDYEDIVLKDSTFYVLVSNGDIVAFRFFNPDSFFQTRYQFPYEGKNEFEAMYISGSHLVLICKDCAADKKKSLGTYSFNTDQVQYAPGILEIDADAIAARTGKRKIKFKPSAARVHPLERRLYLLSAVNNLLVITDSLGVPLEVAELSKSHFKQPEGLEFAPNGTMIISNEAAGTGVANILIFPYSQKRQP